MAVPCRDDNDRLPDERPQRRREWTGVLPSVVLPLAILGAVLAVAWSWTSERSTSVSSAGGQVSSSYLVGSGAEAKPGHPAPNVRLLDLEASPRLISDLRGRSVLLNFWATWCGPCRTEVPRLVAIAATADAAFAVVGINLGEPRGDVRAFANDYGVSYPVLLDPNGEAARRYDVTSAPVSVLVGANGKVLDVVRGPIDDATVERLTREARSP